MHPSEVTRRLWSVLALAPLAACGNSSTAEVSLWQGHSSQRPHLKVADWDQLSAGHIVALEWTGLFSDEHQVLLDPDGEARLLPSAALEDQQQMLRVALPDDLDSEVVLAIVDSRGVERGRLVEDRVVWTYGQGFEVYPGVVEVGTVEWRQQFRYCAGPTPPVCAPLSDGEVRALLGDTGWVEQYDVSPAWLEGTEAMCCSNFMAEPAVGPVGGQDSGYGRPLVHNGQRHLAEAGTGPGWQTRVALVEPLDRQTRERGGGAWLAAGLEEHASIAAFARFQLQLMAVGAPSELVMEAAAAQADEVAHARFAFGLAETLGAEGAAPGPMSLPDSLGPVDLESVVLAAVAEGCIAETIAAAQLAAASRASVPSLRAPLSRMAEDEGRHSALAWRFLDWALRQQPELAPKVADLLLAGARRAEVVSADPGLVQLGLLSGVERRRVAMRVAEDLLRPYAASLRAA